MRLFIAVLFDDDTVDRLVELRDALHDKAVHGSFVSRDNLHLTLEFLGECDSAERNKAIEAMRSIDFSPFDITMNRIGCFTRPDGDTWWVGAEESGALMGLQRNLHRELEGRGLRLERRRYKPHITLGRRVIGSMAAGAIEAIGCTVSGFDLMLSERIDGHMVYTSLFHRS